MKEILLFSCGIDSLSAWFFCGKPRCFYVDLNSDYSKLELECIKKLEKLIPDLKVEIIKGIDLGQYERKKNAFIPNRNLILASLVTDYGNRIILAGIQDDRVCDKSEKAFKLMSKCLTGINESEEIEVYSPFWKMSKIKIIRWMLDNVKDAEKILKTSVSCYSSGAGQCGNCKSCMRKYFALKINNIDCEDWFNIDPRTSLYINEYITQIKTGVMEKERAKETKKLLIKLELWEGKR